MNQSSHRRECDSMGHLATHNYMRIFDDATYHLLARLGYVLRDAQSTQRGWADVSHQIEYQKELVAGDLVVAVSSIVRLGRTSLTYRTRLLRTSGDAAECAVLTGVAVHFDLGRRVAIELPDELRAAAGMLANPLMASGPSVAASS
ncbi:MAG TPA: acyl-CoA thioesterase [Steroidobacteraceae bacterium]|nr:acyl-CoA thioesterase [Steroidobacteraceae bacterium]